MVTVGSATWRKVSPSSARRTVCRMARADCGCAAPAWACAARRRLAAVGTVQSKPTLQLHNPCHQRRVRGQQCRNGFFLRGILSLQTRNDLLRHFGSAGSLSVIITRRRFQSRYHEQVDSCHESRVKRFPAATYLGSYVLSLWRAGRSMRTGARQFSHSQYLAPEDLILRRYAPPPWRWPLRRRCTATPPPA